MTLDGELIEDTAALTGLLPSWEALAEAGRSPMSLPGWTVAWLHHLSPDGTRPRVVVVRDRGEVVGIAPMFVEDGAPGRVDYRVAGAPLPRVSPLSVPDREWDVARVVAEVLSSAQPRADALALESHGLRSPWPQALTSQWPTKLAPVVSRYLVQPSPVISLRSGCMEGWMAGKSSRLRSELRRRWRRFQEAGGTVRAATYDTLRADVDSFLRLHRGRWEGRGDSSIVAQEDRARAFFIEAGEAYVRDGRFRLFILELDGLPIAAQMYAAAGAEVLALNTGWDESYAKLSPTTMCFLGVLEDAFARGDRRIDLAPGALPHKTSLADGDDPVAWTLLMLPGARLPFTVARTAPMIGKRWAVRCAKRALEDEQIDQMRALRARLQRAPMLGQAAPAYRGALSPSARSTSLRIRSGSCISTVAARATAPSLERRSGSSR